MLSPTARQLEILALIDQGLSVADIAEILGIAVSTVSVHIERLKSRMGVSSIAELRKWLVRKRMREVMEAEGMRESLITTILETL